MRKKSNFVVEVLVKEQRGPNLVKVDSFKGSADVFLRILEDKYSNPRTTLDRMGEALLLRKVKTDEEFQQKVRKILNG